MNISFDLLQRMSFAPLPISLRVGVQAEWYNESLYRNLNVRFDFLCQNINISFDLLQRMTFAPLPVSLGVRFQAGLNESFLQNS